MSDKKLSSIMDCPFLGNFAKDGCTTFTVVGPGVLVTKFDGANINHIVEISDFSGINQDPCYYVDVTFYLSRSFSWRVSDIEDHRESFLKISEQLESGCEITSAVTGGDNSFWHFMRNANSYELVFEISGSRGDAGFTYTVPKEQGDDCVRIMKRVYQSAENYLVR